MVGGGGVGSWGWMIRGFCRMIRGGVGIRGRGRGGMEEGEGMCRGRMLFLWGLGRLLWVVLVRLRGGMVVGIGVGIRGIGIEVIGTGIGRGTLGGEMIEIGIGRDESPVRGLPGGSGIGVGIGTGGNGLILASGGISMKVISGGG